MTQEMAKRPETIFKRLQKDGKQIQEDKDKSAKRPGKMQIDEKRSGTILKRWQKDPKDSKKMAKRPGKWQRYGRKTQNNRETSAGNMAKRRRMILKRRQKDPER